LLRKYVIHEQDQEEYKKEQTTYLKQEKKFLGKLAVQFEKMHDICKEIDLLGENNFDYDL